MYLRSAPVPSRVLRRDCGGSAHGAQTKRLGAPQGELNVALRDGIDATPELGRQSARWDRDLDRHARPLASSARGAEAPMMACRVQSHRLPVVRSIASTCSPCVLRITDRMPGAPSAPTSGDPTWGVGGEWAVRRGGCPSASPQTVSARGARARTRADGRGSTCRTAAHRISVGR
jgi:hypothetical protein